MRRVLEEVARLSGELDARRAILKDGLGPRRSENMIQMVRGFGNELVRQGGILKPRLPGIQRLMELVARVVKQKMLLFYDNAWTDHPLPDV